LAILGLELLPDLLELGLDHRSRHFEVVIGGELVEQLALHLRAGQARPIPARAAPVIRPLSLSRLSMPERLGEVLVDLALPLGP
jgi:hypothetical protein